MRNGRALFNMGDNGFAIEPAKLRRPRTLGFFLRAAQPGPVRIRVIRAERAISERLGLLQPEATLRAEALAKVLLAVPSTGSSVGAPSSEALPPSATGDTTPTTTGNASAARGGVAAARAALADDPTTERRTAWRAKGLLLRATCLREAGRYADAAAALDEASALTDDAAVTRARHALRQARRAARSGERDLYRGQTAPPPERRASAVS